MSIDAAYSDEELTSFLDGELDSIRTQSIIERLKTDSELAMRLEQLDLNKEELKHAFEGLLNQAPNSQQKHTHVVTDQPTRFWAKGAIAASLIACMIVGAIGGQLIGNRALAGNWKEYVAAYQKLYVTQTLSEVSDNEPQRRIELQRITAATGANIELEQIKSTKDLILKRAQILGFEGRAIGQITYLTPLGVPVALCIRRVEGNSSSPVQMLQMEGLQTAVWHAGDFEFMLIGGQDRDLINRAAQQIKQRFG